MARRSRSANGHSLSFSHGHPAVNFGRHDYGEPRLAGILSACPPVLLILQSSAFRKEFVAQTGSGAHVRQYPSINERGVHPNSRIESWNSGVLTLTDFRTGSLRKSLQ